MLSKNRQALVEAYNKGYRVVNGEVISPYRSEPLSIKARNTSGYKKFSVSYDGERMNVLVHWLVAYQKFKEGMFEEGVEVRHADGDCANNLEDNILLGTHTDNERDKPSDVALRVSIEAATHIRKFTDAEVADIRAFRDMGATYADIMAEYDITSKGTVSYIINNKYKTKV